MTNLLWILLGATLAQVVLTGLVLWLSARISRIRSATFLRALVAALLMTAIAAAIVVAQWRWAPGMPLTGALFVLVLQLAAIWVLIRWLLRASPGRAALAGLLMLAIIVPINIAGGLLVRARLAEAFVLPTGGMAPTLIGLHYRHACGDCGHGFEVGADWPPDLRRQPPVNCPNCGLLQTEQPWGGPADGDRVLALKTVRPKRWDLVVFRNPARPADTFVQRLVGLPGEQVEIAGGDVFIDGRRAERPPDAREDMWVPVADTGPLTGDGSGPFGQAVGTGKSHGPAARAWQAVATSAPDDPDRLDFTGPITDELAYNGTADGADFVNVGDIRVTCDLAGFQGGTITFSWQHAGRSWQAEFTGGKLLWIRIVDENEFETGVDWPFRKVSRVAFQFRDGQATVLLDGRVVLSKPIGPQDIKWARRQDASPPPAPCRMTLAASGGDFHVRRIRVCRDIYYTVSVPGPSAGPMPVVRSGMRLGPEQYFMLGDNSRSSSDSRMWTQVDPSLSGAAPPGAVPEGLLVGVVRWLYWPPERWRAFE